MNVKNGRPFEENNIYTQIMKHFKNELNKQCMTYWKTVCKKGKGRKN